MNDVLKIAAGVILALVILAALPATMMFVIWVVFPLFLVGILSYGVAVLWRRAFPKMMSQKPDTE